MTDLDDVRKRLIDAMALDPKDHEGWLEIAEERLYAARAREHPFKRQYDVSTVGARIRTAREVCGMSLEQCGLRLGVHKLELSKWERGLRNMPADKLRSLCLVVGVSQAWLLGTSEEGGPPVPAGLLRKRKTKKWKQKRDYLAAKAKAKAEAARLNAKYRPEVDVSAQNSPVAIPAPSHPRPKEG